MQLRHQPSDMKIEMPLGPQSEPDPDAFLDIAAVMKSLDLIVTVDTSIAHLGGALGCPTWVVVKNLPDWRWLLDRDDSPWYPTVRLFRQAVDGDWRSAFDSVETALARGLRGR